ncbi:MAG TPA: hypothetical protein DEB39_08280 [Planctomycetaceae bacterium]|nr:hypothetical protein [Planctomycetaceae bacterium]
MIHGQFTRQLLEQDVEKLTTYYRKLGFFYAKVDYDIDETQGYTGLGEPNSWVNITFLVDEGPRCKIRDIRFIGNKLFSEGELKKELKSRIGKFYYQDMVEVDMGKVREEYGIRGHVFAEANPDPRIDGDEVELIIHVKEGPQCRVGEIKMEIVGIDGAEPYTALSTAMNRLSFKPGDLMNTREIENSERRLRFAGVFNSNPATGMLPNFTFEMPEQYLVDEERRRNEEKQQMIASPEKSNYRGQAPSNTLWYRKPVDVPGEPLRKNTGTSGTNPGPNPEESLEAFSNFFRIRTPQPVIPQSVTPQSVTPHSVRKPPVGMNTRPAPYPSGPLTGPLAGPHARSLYLGQQTYGAPTASPYNPYNSADGSAGSGLNAAPAPIAQPSQNQGIYGNPYGSIVSPIENPGNTPANLGVLPMSDPAAAPRPQNPIYPIRVHGIAQETRTGQLMMSVAVNSDSGLMGRFVIEEQNFDALRWPKNPSRMADWRNAFRGKGQIFRIEAVPGEQVQRYEVSWATPYLFNLDYSLRTSGYYYQRFYDEWYEDRVGGTISVGKNWTKDLSTSISYNGGNIRMYHPISPIPERLYSALGNNDFHTFGLTLTHDTRDNQYLATEGHLFTAGVSQTVGKHQYLAGTYDIRQYFMLRERPDRSGRWVLALRSAAGVTEGNTPIYDRYYAGGFSSIRGYEYRSVTPRDPYALNTGIGGTFEFYNSAELVFPLTADDMIRGLVFVDSGTVQEDIRDWQDDYRVSTGFGFRITIPMMGPAPIALDFAFPLVKSEFDKTQLFTFNVGFFR